MSYEEKYHIIRCEGFTDYQAKTIYNEMNCYSLETEQEIINAANEWWNMQRTMEKCGL